VGIAHQNSLNLVGSAIPYDSFPQNSHQTLEYVLSHTDNLAKLPIFILKKPAISTDTLVVIEISVDISKHDFWCFAAKVTYERIFKQYMIIQNFFPKRKVISEISVSNFSWKYHEEENMLRQKTQRTWKILAVLMLLFIASLNVSADDYTAAIQKGLEYLRNTQDQNTGTWSSSYPVGSTGLAALAFLNHGIGESDPQVKKAIEYIISQQGTDGRIGNRPGYTTAIALSALRATGNHAYDEVIRKAKDYYVNDQNADGGWRYDPSYTTSDHSVYQWAVLGIYEAYEFLDLERNDATWGNAKRYLNDTQHQDGGWGYQNGSSYGSMTAAGLWSSFYCGIPLTDPGTQKALEWVGKNYRWDANPGSGSWLRYYQYTLAKGLALYGKKAIVDSSGVTHDWHKELSEMLVAQQQPDGRWTGALYDSRDVLATSYVLLILELRTWPQGKYSITFELTSNHSDIYVFDPTGLQVNKDVNEIDEAEFSTGPPQKITLNKSKTSYMDVK